MVREHSSTCNEFTSRDSGKSDPRLQKELAGVISESMSHRTGEGLMS